MARIGASMTRTFKKCSVNLGREYNFLIVAGGHLVVAKNSHFTRNCCSKKIGNGNTFSSKERFGK